MTSIVDGASLRKVLLGNGPTAAKLMTISGAATHQLFTVTGGEVLITAIWGVCTTAMAGANTINLQSDPTTGDTVVIGTATDLGTTDTAAGTTIGFIAQGDGTIDLVKGAFALRDWVVTTGEIESVATEVTADGAIQWYCTWIPLDTGATVTASA